MKIDLFIQDPLSSCFGIRLSPNHSAKSLEDFITQPRFSDVKWKLVDGVMQGIKPDPLHEYLDVRYMALPHQDPKFGVQYPETMTFKF